MVKIKAYAKLNLTLEINGVENGFHMLDSLCASVDIFDLITLKKRKDNNVVLIMHGLGSESIPLETNNAYKAATLFMDAFQTTGADITVHKNIPMGAGLGGSSADAAGVINGMAKLYGVTDEKTLTALAERLGSDTSYMRKGGFARMQGRGEKITPLSLDTQLHFLLLCPNTPVSTKACFDVYDTLPKTLEWKESAAESCYAALGKNDLNEVGRYLTNDLFLAATSLNPDVQTAYDEAKSFSPLGVSMTGSGSGVFALFDSKELCLWAKSRYRGKARAYVVSTVQEERKSVGFRNPYQITEN